MRQPVQARTLAFDQGAIRSNANAISAPSISLFDPATPALHATPVSHGGRQAAWFVSGEFGPAVLRHYRRGGLVARLSSRQYVWTGAESTRSFAEFELLRYMYEKGLPVPKPLAAIYWRHGLAYSAALLIERLADTQTLARVVKTASPEAVARAIFDMHEAGVWHADLNAYNILLDKHGAAWVIDFDRGRRHALLSLARRHANLFRLRRSLIKVAASDGLEWWMGLNQAYIRLLKAKEHI